VRPILSTTAYIVSVVFFKRLDTWFACFDSSVRLDAICIWTWKCELENSKITRNVSLIAAQVIEITFKVTRSRRKFHASIQRIWFHTQQPSHQRPYHTIWYLLLLFADIAVAWNIEPSVIALQISVKELQTSGIYYLQLWYLQIIGYICKMLIKYEDGLLDVIRGNKRLLTLYGHHFGDWYTGRWWVSCYIWYSEEGPRRAAAHPSIHRIFRCGSITASALWRVNSGKNEACWSRPIDGLIIIGFIDPVMSITEAWSGTVNCSFSRWLWHVLIVIEDRETTGASTSTHHAVNHGVNHCPIR